MSLVFDEDELAAEEGILPGDWRVLCSVEEIERICQEYEERVEKAEQMIEEVGVRPLVEALQRRGVLRDDRFDGWFEE